VEKREAFLELEELEEVEDSTEDEILEKEREWESVSLAKNIEELRQEIETIKNLIKKTKEVMEREEETKLRELKKSLGGGFKNHRRERRKQKDFDLYRIKGHLGVFAEKGKGLGLLGMHHTRWNALGGENKSGEGL
jgi:septal ring factor EnvC (AmiA/AmiB activator)